MKKLLLIACSVSLLPLTANAGFDVNGVRLSPGPSQTQTSSPNAVPVAPVTKEQITKKPALTISYDRYVPDTIQKKLKIQDAPRQMIAPAPVPVQEILPVPVAAPAGVMKPKLRNLVIVGGTPPVIKAPVVPQQQIAGAPAPQALAEPVKIIEAPKPVIIPVPKERFDTWRARKGENLKDVLARWSEREGTDFTWAAYESPKIGTDFSFVGEYGDAVTKLMMDSDTKLKMQFNADDKMIADATMPVVMNSAPVSLVAPEPNLEQDIMPTTAAPALPTSIQENKNAKWFASQGASLKEVLLAWAENEGAELVWDMPQNGTSVRRPLSHDGTFEEAIEEILSAYDNADVRPVGQLYKNPQNGKKVLVIQPAGA